MTATDVDLTKSVEDHGGIFCIRGGGGENCRSWNNIQYKVGMSANNV